MPVKKKKKTVKPKAKVETVSSKPDSNVVGLSWENEQDKNTLYFKPKQFTTPNYSPITEPKYGPITTGDYNIPEFDITLDDLREADRDRKLAEIVEGIKELKFRLDAMEKKEKVTVSGGQIEKEVELVCMFCHEKSKQMVRMEADNYCRTYTYTCDKCGKLNYDIVINQEWDTKPTLKTEAKVTAKSEGADYTVTIEADTTSQYKYHCSFCDKDIKFPEPISHCPYCGSSIMLTGMSVDCKYNLK